ncbi:acyl-CoA dehydrogenase NM domain-like protein [Rhodotorula sp. JG-1b]|nr:acyl-CoA dehydrogenase NM domain-like protein [Rhodotorula sp. JG-1b]
MSSADILPPPSKTRYLTVPDTAAKKDSLKQFSVDEVKQHNKEDDLWIIIDSAVYDLSKFVDLHPGGSHVLMQVAGQDATEAFFGMHRSDVLTKYGRYLIGTVSGQKPTHVLPTPGTLSPVPYAEAMWLTEGYKSPYYNDSHRRLQKFIREFNDEYVRPDAQLHELDGKRPTPALIQKMGDLKINHMRMGPSKVLHGLDLPGGIKGEDFDYFHELVITQEFSRCGARGYMDGFQGGMVIGLPPVMNFGSKKLQQEIIPEVLAGRKWISLAVTEAFAGSDVAGLRTTAKKTEDGKHYIISGTKKWITNGHFSDYFSVAVNTGNGLSMILVPRGEGVETKLIKTSYSTTAGTAYITFDNVKVPVENLLGQEGKGLFVVLSNFNHERWTMCCGSIAGSRMIAEECFKWIHQRKAFGKPLVDLAVLRAKMANMFARIEALQAWLENITYQMCHMTYAQQADLLAGQIGLLKQQCTRVAGEVADDATQIFGGRGLTQSGMGIFIERFQRTQKFDALLGGAEEVLADLGVRQASRKMPKAVL